MRLRAMTKKSLIISGTASIVPEMISVLKNNNYEIDLTYRNKEKMLLKKELYGEDVNWIELNFDSPDSTNIFCENVGSYDVVVILPASSPGRDFFTTPESQLRMFYSNYVVNVMLTTKKILEKLSDDGKIIYISSVAANRPVPDINYAVAKGVIQIFFTSLSTKVRPTQSVFSLAPGLIYDTQAFYDNDPSNYNNDPSQLATKEEIASFLIKSDVNNNGKVIKLGKD